MTSDERAYYVRASGVKEKKVGADIALYVETKRSIHVLNSTARFIWECLREPKTSAEIHFLLSESFDVDAETLKSDLEEALELFEHNGLIQKKADADENLVS